MTADPAIPVDRLAALASPETQRLAAHMAHDTFSALFRLALEPSADSPDATMEALRVQCSNWCSAGEGEDAQALRLALLIAGLDQWGLAYTQAFNLTALPALSRLLGDLRSPLSPTADARFQTFFAQIEAHEGDAVDFKIELRRNIHLALWHAMSASEDPADGERIVQTLGSLMLALVARMPTLGWRLLADGLASIQIRLLSDPAFSGEVSQNGTQQLFESLRRALPPEQYRGILAHAGQAVLSWQQRRRPAQ